MLLDEVKTYNFGFLLAGLLVCMLLLPLVSGLDFAATALLTEVAFLLILLVGVWSLLGSVLWFRVGIALTVLSGLMTMGYAVWPSDWLSQAIALLTLLFLVLSSAIAFKSVFSSGKVDINRLFGAACIYLMFALIWALMYMLLDSYQSQSMSAAQFTESAQIVVIDKNAVGKSLPELDIASKFGVLLTSVTRMRMEIPRTADFMLRKGDILTVVGPRDNVDLLGEELGHVEREIAETDMVTFAFGIAIGVVIGLFAVNVGQLSIGLGSAGGLLTAGLAIGYLRSIHPTFGRLPDAARWILMEFGLLLFMAGVGLRAGGDIIETFAVAGPTLVLAGIVVTITPILVGYFFGRKVLKMHPVLLFGGITGSMTSGASLSVVTKAANSSMPSLGYTGAYAFANVLLTVAGSIILFF